MSIPQEQYLPAESLTPCSDSGNFLFTQPRDGMFCTFGISSSHHLNDWGSFLQLDAEGPVLLDVAYPETSAKFFNASNTSDR